MINIHSRSKDDLATADTPSTVQQPSADEHTPVPEQRVVDDGQQPCTSHRPTAHMSDTEVRAYWQDKLGDGYDIVIGAMEKPNVGGLGMALEGTVDVVDGVELRPHHFIQRMHPDGPAGRCGRLRAGDELLEVNGTALYGVSHLDVRRALGALPGNCAVRMVVARRTLMPMQVCSFGVR
jgi:hypothetical protein